MTFSFRLIKSLLTEPAFVIPAQITGNILTEQLIGNPVKAILHKAVPSVGRLPIHHQANSRQQ